MAQVNLELVGNWEYVVADMLEPREADLPVLFLILVVLPLVIYVLLGRWSDASEKKARISMLSQLTAEEAFRVEEVALVNVVTPTVPCPKIPFYECAKCFAPATTRCSKCKSVRYCSGRCQIMHWRDGHKNECQQLARARNLTLSADSIKIRPFIVDDSQHGDFLYDASSVASITINDVPYTMTPERKLSVSEKRVPNKVKKEMVRSSGVSSACAFVDAVDSGDTSATCGLSSKDASLENKLGSESFTSSFEANRFQDTTTLRNLSHQPHKITMENRNMVKPKGVAENSENGVNECGTSTIFTSEDGFNSSSEALDLNCSAEDTSIRGGVMYMRPPYTLGSTSLTSQKSARFMDDESRVSSNYVSTSAPLQHCNGSRKSSKVEKPNIMGLINDCSKIKMLFPYEELVKYFQCELWGVSPRGLLNCGNSCYANAVLQCLTCTKPLMVCLLRRSHSKTCRVRDWCLMCELEHHVLMLREGGGPMSPSRILSNMRNIGCRMGGGNQEDAHEFLRLLVMSMQSICLEGLGGEKQVHPRLQETTLIQQIFGGRLKSKVKCMRCHLESERYENIMDLTLEIHGWVESLEDALTQFTAPEDLDGENMYRCGRCAAYVKARKQLSVHEVPNILTIVLKRFQSGRYGKINKCVTFPEMLDMIPFVTGTSDSPPLYMLYGVIVHLDTLNASFSGHYVSYVKDLQGTWFRIDDSEVQAVSLSEVMSEGTYILFYSRSFPRPPRTYIEKASVPKTQKTSRHGQHILRKQSGEESSRNDVNYSKEGSIHPRGEISMEFSDATSSDWSIFTSSDESSFTTESTRDSVSTIDHTDSTGLDPISLIFAPPFYLPEYNQSNTISCTKFSSCRPQTRYFSERRGFVIDYVHKEGSSRSNCNL